MSELEAARRLAFLLAKGRQMLLDKLVARLTQLPEKSRTAAIDLAAKSTATMAWVPNQGPQTQAFTASLNTAQAAAGPG